MATTAPERCSKWSPPMVFKVEGDCGTGGLVVLEADSYSGRLTITNQVALLAARRTASSASATDTTAQPVPTRSIRATGRSPTVTARRPGTPTRHRSATATTVASTVAADGGGAADAGIARDAGAPPSSPCQSGYRHADATLESDGLWFTCRSEPDAVLCRSKLTVQP